MVSLRRLIPGALAAAAGVFPIALAGAQTAKPSTVITGAVIGANGRIPVRADVELVPTRNANGTVRAVVAPDGTFRVEYPGSGPFLLRVAGVGYSLLERALPMTAPESLDVRVVLAGLPAGLGRGPIAGVSSERDAEKARADMPPAVLLSPRGNGRRTGALRARRDTVVYRVVDITASVYLPPTGADAYEFASDGEYVGVMRATPGQDVQLVYDSTLVAFGGTSSLRVLTAGPVATIVAQLDSIFAFAPARRCVLQTEGAPFDTASSLARDTALAVSLQLVRQLLVADAACQTSPALGRAVAALFGPRSTLWELEDVMRRRVLLTAERHAIGQPRFTTPEIISAVRARFDGAIAAATDTTARFDLYSYAAQTFMPADTAAARAYTGRFVAESYDHPRVTPLLRLTGYNRVLQPGRTLPAFSARSLDTGTPPLTNGSLRGKVVLLDVWATWCPDCIVEFPAMRALHEKYGPRGLSIVSLSVDEQQSTADRFRRTREPMPWTHGWVGALTEGRDGPLAAFEVAWLPTTVLLGKDGKILAFSPKLDSPEFAALIEKALR